MKRTLVVSLLMLAILALITPITTIAQEMEGGGLDHCAICEHYGVPHSCRMCAMADYYENGGCFPGDPHCA